MGKRAFKHKKGSIYDSDGDDSASTSSTARSDNVLTHGFEDIQIEDGNILDEALDALHEKRSSTREKALSIIIEAFRKSLQYEFVENKSVTLLRLCLNSIKKGSVQEKFLACQAIGLLALTVGCGDKAHEILVDAVPIFSQALKSPSESSSVLLECLAIITFVGGEDTEETERSMEIMWQLAHPKHGSNVTAKKISASVITSMVSAWSFLLTTMDNWAINSKDWKGSISYFSSLLDKDDRSVRIAAGEAQALIFEMGSIEKFYVDGKDSTEDTISNGMNSRMLTLKGNIINQVRKLSIEAGGKGSAKKDLNNQRFLFRDILEFLEYGSRPETSMKIGGNTIRTSNWHEMIQLNFLKRFLAGGFTKHMEDNEFLHDVFGFSPVKRMTKSDKKTYGYANSALDKERTLKLNKQRMLSQGKNAGHYAVGVEDED